MTSKAKKIKKVTVKKPARVKRYKKKENVYIKTFDNKKGWIKVLFKED